MNRISPKSYCSCGTEDSIKEMEPTREEAKEYAANDYWDGVLYDKYMGKYWISGVPFIENLDKEQTPEEQAD